MNFRRTIKILALLSLILICLMTALCACGRNTGEIEHIPTSAVSELQAVQLVNSKDVKTIVFNRVSANGDAQLDVKEQEEIDHYMKMIGRLRLTEITHQSTDDDSLSITIYTRDDILRLTVEGDHLIFDDHRIVCENVYALKSAVDTAIRKSNTNQPPSK